MRLATIRMPCETREPARLLSPRRRILPGACAGPAWGTAAEVSTVVVLMGAPASDRELLVIAVQPAAVEGGEDDQYGQQQDAVRGRLGEVTRLLSEAQVVGPGDEDLRVRRRVAEQQEDHGELVERPDDAEQYDGGADAPESRQGDVPEPLPGEGDQDLHGARVTDGPDLVEQPGDGRLEG